MSARIPDTAKQIDSTSTILPSGRWKGKRITMCLYDGYASKGYRSNYQPIHHQWVKFEIVGGPKGCRSYSGKNLKLAAQQLAELRAASV